MNFREEGERLSIVPPPPPLCRVQRRAAIPSRNASSEALEKPRRNAAMDIFILPTCWWRDHTICIPPTHLPKTPSQKQNGKQVEGKGLSLQFYIAKNGLDYVEFRLGKKKGSTKTTGFERKRRDSIVRKLRPPSPNCQPRTRRG